jgi:hypothetical protein
MEVSVSSKARQRSWLLVILLPLVLGLAAACQGPSSSNDELETELSSLKTERDLLSQQVETLNTNLEAAQIRVDRLESDLKNAQVARANGPGGTAPSQEPQQAPGQRPLPEVINDLGRLGQVLAQDRLLLIEIRKPIPDDRDAGIQSLRNIRGLAQRADHTLVSGVDKVLFLAPAYYDWTERAEANNFASQVESTTLYNLWVAPYQNALDQFLEDSLLYVIQHLDEASIQLSSLSS